MKDLFSTMLEWLNLAVGLAVFAVLMWAIVKAHSHWWRRVAVKYATSPRTVRLAAKVPETVIITARPGSKPTRPEFGYRVYGVCRLVIYEAGLSISQAAPFNARCHRLFLPFDEMEVQETDWGLSQAYSLRMRQIPETDIIVFPRVVRWIREHVDRPPFGASS